VQVIPAVDVLGGAVVRLARGSYDDVTRYASDPVEALVRWAAEGAELVHVVDLAGARDGLHPGELVSRLAAAGVAFQIGGGIRTVADAVAAVAGGAARVVVGTAAVWDTATVEEMVGALGEERVVAALDVREGRARGAGWRDGGLPVAEAAQRLASAGVGRALVTGIGGDGMMTGPDLALLATVAEAAPRLALIGSGGVGTLADLVALRDAGAEAAIVGRALYEGRFTLAEAMGAVA
jgi:phosphoribosylformimino-5-aminoimidazole carboxamide ribotide isomerase